MRALTHPSFLSAFVASALLMGAPALAQDDHGGWLDEKSDPLAPDKAPKAEGEASKAGEEDLSPDEKRKRDRQINKNYSDAQKTYQEILSSDPTSPLDRRIKNNERIVKEFSGRIRETTQQRRQAQVNLYNRTFQLKQQRDKKTITEEVYQRLITEEEEKFTKFEASTKRNVVGWQKEVDDAQQRLKGLRAQRRLLEASRPRERKVRRTGKNAKGDGMEPSRLAGTLRQRLDRIASYDTRHTLDNVHPRSLGSSLSRRAN